MRARNPPQRASGHPSPLRNQQICFLAPGKCDRNERSASFLVQTRRFSMPDTQQHGGTDEDSCIGIVRRRPSWHGIYSAGASRGAGHERATCNHRSRLALRPGLACQSLGALRSEPTRLSPLPILGATALPPPSPSLAASSVAAPSPPRTPPSSPRTSFVIA